MKRRAFLQAAGGMVAAPLVIPSRVLGADAPSNRVAMGLIGLGDRGEANLGAFMKRAQIVALCDLDPGSERYEPGKHFGLAPMQAKCAPHAKGAVPLKDFRELLARRDIDAVCISTPDHWHAPMVVAAAAAGKDIYCEKPLSLTVRHGRAMVEAVTRAKRVFQCGSQRRSDAKCRKVCELVRNGRIGKLQTVRAGLMGGHWVRTLRKDAPPTPEPPPEGFDWNFWLGPAPEAPYLYNRCHWNWRWHLDYSGGMVTDWGAHMLDMAHWGMGRDEGGPVEVEGKAQWPARDALYNTATSFEFTATYADGVKVVVKNGPIGVRFEGSEGWIDLDGKSEPAGLFASEIKPEEIHLYDSKNDHQGNFLDCVKSRKPTAAPIETAHRTITVAHLGNIAMRLGRKIRWDPAAEQVVGDDEAAALLDRPLREPWRL